VKYLKDEVNPLGETVFRGHSFRLV
jgi:hypothetical protein